MDLVAKLPAMEDTALAVLHQNAQRLEQSGTKTQKSAAAALLPAIESELATRRAAKLEAAKTKRAASAALKAKTRPSKAKGASSRSKTAAAEQSTQPTD